MAVKRVWLLTRQLDGVVKFYYFTSLLAALAFRVVNDDEQCDAVYTLRTFD